MYARCSHPDNQGQPSQASPRTTLCSFSSREPRKDSEMGKAGVERELEANFKEKHSITEQRIADKLGHN